MFPRLEMDYFSTNSSFLFREALGQRFVMSDLGSQNIGGNGAEAETPVLWPPDAKS